MRAATVLQEPEKMCSIHFILLQTQYNECSNKIKQNSYFIAAFILFHFTCNHGFTLLIAGVTYQ